MKLKLGLKLDNFKSPNAVRDGATPQSNVSLAATFRAFQVFITSVYPRNPVLQCHTVLPLYL
jgi:hypothetical protein